MASKIKENSLHSLTQDKLSLFLGSVFLFNIVSILEHNAIKKTHWIKNNIIIYL